MKFEELSQGGYLPHRQAVEFLTAMDAGRNWRSYLYHNRIGQTEAPVIQFRRYAGEVFYRRADLVHHWNEWHLIRLPLKFRIRRLASKFVAGLVGVLRPAAA